jgi:phosphoribosylamine--glycine ligase
MDFDAVADFVADYQIALVVVGPEAPLAAGLADFLREKNIATVGPGAKGAVLESSKEWSKRFMQRHNIPTAAYRSFTAEERAEAVEYVRNHALPVVVKASGLAAGKGVLICESHEEAVAGVEEMLSGSSFGEAGATIVVEEFLTGIELSVFVLTDGEHYALLPEAKDYKRIGEGDTGLNTGGMGSVSPVPFADDAFMDKVRAQVIEPTVQGLREEGIPYRGFIFFGLIRVEGEPCVIEYNVRMGDPETQTVFPRIGSDVVELLEATAKGSLQGMPVKFVPETHAAVILVSGGYPGKYEKGKVITGTEAVEGSILFHAGTKLEDGALKTNGGRVIAITSAGADIASAVKQSLENAEKIGFEGKYYRKDIGQDLL